MLTHAGSEVWSSRPLPGGGRFMVYIPSRFRYAYVSEESVPRAEEAAVETRIGWLICEGLSWSLTQVLAAALGTSAVRLARAKALLPPAQNEPIEPGEHAPVFFRGTHWSRVRRNPRGLVEVLQRGAS